MAEHDGFFDGDTEYGQDELLRYYDTLFYSGIAVSSAGVMDYAVTASAGKVQVAKGFSILRGAWNYNDSTKSMTVTPDANYDRIDRVVIRLDYSEKTCRIALKPGTAASSPAPPSLQQDSIRHELSLAQVRVSKAGQLTITDERYREELCGAIRPKYFNEMDTMLKEFQAQFDAWFEKQQSLGWRPIAIQVNEPADKVVGMIWI